MGIKTRIKMIKTNTMNRHLNEEDVEDSFSLIVLKQGSLRNRLEEVMLQGGLPVCKAALMIGIHRVTLRAFILDTKNLHMKSLGCVYRWVNMMEKGKENEPTITHKY